MVTPAGPGERKQGAADKREEEADGGAVAGHPDEANRGPPGMQSAPPPFPTVGGAPDCMPGVVNAARRAA